MASQPRCPVCRLPVDIEVGGVGSFLNHLWGHAEKQGKDQTWVDEQFQKAFPDMDDQQRSGDE